MMWPTRCLSSLQSTMTFHCPAKGRYEHPEDCTRFLKCISQEFLACDCKCKAGTFYDFRSHICVSTSLENMNCLQKQGTSTIPIYKSGSTSRWRGTDQIPRTQTIGTPSHKVTTSPTGTRGRNQSGHDRGGNLYVIYRQVSTPLHTFIVDDTSYVPAWLISFLVLLVVIVLIVIVLILY